MGRKVLGRGVGEPGGAGRNRPLGLERERELGPGKDLDLVIKSHQGVLSKGSLGGRGADWEWEIG